MSENKIIYQIPENLIFGQIPENMSQNENGLLNYVKVTQKNIDCFKKEFEKDLTQVIKELEQLKNGADNE